MKDYLAFVVGYNLLPKDYNGLIIGKLEDEITETMSALRKNGFKLDDNEDHILFSFPQDPSVLTDLVPVLIDITLFSDSYFKPGVVKNDGIPIAVWKGVHSVLSVFP